ncbi:MAG: Zn-dependent oligopeptidase [Candidatus Marinimicrobia bacterium]|nr:Zn-dependent oligopeptidase [Candidatus Neomarinimicrobiota bacterium]
MNRNILTVAIIVLVVFLVIMTKNNPQVRRPSSNPLIVEFNEVHEFAKLRPGHIERATKYVLELSDQILAEIIAVPDGERTFENIMVATDDIYAVIESVWSPGYLMGSTHTNEKIRDEGLESSRQIQKYITDISLNEELYNAVIAYSRSKGAHQLTGYKKKFLDDALLNYKRSGFGLPKEKREKVKEIFNELADFGLAFRKNISDFSDTLFVTEEEIKGLPENYKKERLQENGSYAIDMSYPSYRPFMKYSESDETRKNLKFKYNNRAVETNLDVLNNIIRKRRELVEVLGYETYAEYRTEDRMAKNPQNVWDFENDLKNKLRAKGEMDVAEMLAIKSKRIGQKAITIQSWEAGFYENLVLKEKFDLDPEEVRQYFEFNNVTDGLFIVYQKLFNITFKQVENPSVWHEDVLMYEVYDNVIGELIGRFYLDMFPRANKYGHAAAFSVTMGKMTGEGYTKPTTALVCNFPKPTEYQPSLLTHDNVNTYFHEFGHLVHGVLTKSALMGYAGTSVARDFVEAPSQMLENWVWQKESLALFAKHFETGAIIPDELLDKMLAAKNVNSGTKALQQVYYGILDFTLHDGFNPDGDQTTTDIVSKLQNEITLYPYQEGTHMEAAFGHLQGYGAAYYGYKWSEVYAQDMFSIFEEIGIMNEELGMRYRKIILEKGGTEDPLSLVKEFLGREPNSDAFLRSMGLE